MSARCRRRSLLRLDSWTDRRLRALLVRVQTVLLDRPHGSMGLTVEVVADDEARLLALYRALPRLLRHALLTVAEQSYAMLRGHGSDLPQRPWPRRPDSALTDGHDGAE